MNTNYKQQQIGCLLGELAKQISHTQRSLAETLGVAVSVVHGMIKQCLENQWVRIERISQKKCRYLLTEQGRTIFHAFTKNHWQTVLGSLGTMHNHCVAMLEDCVTSNHNKLVLVGFEPLADVLIHCSQRVSGVMIHAVWDVNKPMLSIRDLGAINILGCYDSSWQGCTFVLTCLPEHIDQYLDVLEKINPDARVIDPLDYMLAAAV